MKIFILLTSFILLQDCRIYPGLDNKISIPINPISLMYRIFEGRLSTVYDNDYYLYRLFEITRIDKINSIPPNNPTDNKDKDIRNLEDFIDAIKETKCSVSPKIAEFKLALLTEVDDWRSVWDPWSNGPHDTIWKYILPQQIVRRIFLQKTFDVENSNLPEKMKNFINQYKYNRTQYLENLKKEVSKVYDYYENPINKDDTLEKKMNTIDPYEEDYKNYDLNDENDDKSLLKYDLNDERFFYYKKNDPKNDFYEANSLFAWPSFEEYKNSWLASSPFEEYKKSCSRRKDIIKGNDQSKEYDRIDQAMSNNLFYKKSLYRKEKLEAIWGKGNWTIHLFTFFNWINDLCFNININIDKDTYILKLDDMYEGFIDNDGDLKKRRESILKKRRELILKKPDELIFQV